MRGPQHDRYHSHRARAIPGEETWRAQADGLTRWHRQPTRPQVDNSLVKALGRAHRWKRLLEEGHHTSLTELAQAEGINRSYLCRVLRLTLLAPDLVEVILEGRQPERLTLKIAMQAIPEVWEDQRTLFY